MRTKLIISLFLMIPIIIVACNTFALPTTPLICIVSAKNLGMSGSSMTSNGTYFCVRTEWKEAGRVWKSDDGGKTWIKVSSTPIIGCNAVNNIKMYCTSNDTLIAGCGATGKIGNISYSINRGISWKISYTLGINESIWKFFEDKIGNLYATVYSHDSPISYTHAKLLKSTTNGTSWILLYTFIGRHCHDMWVNPYNNYIYVCVGDSDSMHPCINALYRSKDGGTNWTNIYTKKLFSSIIGKGDSNEIYVGEDVWALGTRTTDRTAIYKFSDDGYSNITLQTVYDYGSKFAGNVFWMANVRGALVFGTVAALRDSPWCVILGISYDWVHFTVIQENICANWTGFHWATASYWETSTIFIKCTVRSGISYSVEVQ